MTCTCSLGMGFYFFTFRMNFKLRGWPPQPPTFSSNSTKITKNAQFQTSVLTCLMEHPVCKQRADQSQSHALIAQYFFKNSTQI